MGNQTTTSTQLQRKWKAGNAPRSQRRVKYHVPATTIEQATTEAVHQDAGIAPSAKIGRIGRILAKLFGKGRAL